MTKCVILAVLILILPTIACVVGGGGSESTDCVSILVDSIKVRDNYVMVDNTITYDCDNPIKYILYKTMCVSPSGEVFSSDRGSVFIHYNLNNSGHAGTEYNISVIDTNYIQVDACYSEITEVVYEG